MNKNYKYFTYDSFDNTIWGCGETRNKSMEDAKKCAGVWNMDCRTNEVVLYINLKTVRCSIATYNRIIEGELDAYWGKCKDGLCRFVDEVDGGDTTIDFENLPTDQKLNLMYLLQKEILEKLSDSL
jgi:hypothetical protein